MRRDGDLQRERGFGGGINVGGRGFL